LSANVLDAVAGGQADLGTVLNRRAAFDRHLRKLEAALVLERGIDARQVVLGLPPVSSPWMNGMRATRLGLLLTTPILIVNYWAFFHGGGFYSSANVPLAVVVDVMTVIVTWAALAFFFGYYFPFLRGRSGVTKGIRLAILLAIVQIPVWLFTATSLWAIVFDGILLCEFVVFLALIGAVVFDYRSLRDALADRLNLVNYVRLVGMGGLLTLAGAGVAGAAASVLIALVGEVAKVAVSQFLSAPPAHP
jgi:hypothetical protein